MFDLSQVQISQLFGLGANTSKKQVEKNDFTSKSTSSGRIWIFKFQLVIILANPSFFSFKHDKIKIYGPLKKRWMKCPIFLEI